MIDKAMIRAAMRARRDSLSLEERRRRAAPLVARVVASEAFEQAGTILVYVAMRGEVPLAELVAAARGGRKRVVLPRVVPGTRELALHGWPEEGELVRGEFGVAEPPPSWETVAPGSVDLALVPGLAFDLGGGRLGQGGGYYDTLLPQLAPRPGRALPRRVGVAWAFQMVPAVPREAHDAGVDAIVTEERWHDVR